MVQWGEGDGHPGVLPTLGLEQDPGSCTDSRASFTVAGELGQAQVLLPGRMGMAEKAENGKSPPELSVLVG